MCPVSPLGTGKVSRSGCRPSRAPGTEPRDRRFAGISKLQGDAAIMAAEVRAQFRAYQSAARRRSGWVGRTPARDLASSGRDLAPQLVLIPVAEAQVPLRNRAAQLRGSPLPDTRQPPRYHHRHNHPRAVEFRRCSLPVELDWTKQPERPRGTEMSRTTCRRAFRPFNSVPTKRGYCSAPHTTSG